MSKKFTGITSAGSAIPVYDKDAHSALQNKADVSALTAYQEKGDYYSASNPSGFITGVDLTPYQEKSAMTAFQTVEGMSAYQPVGEYYSASNPSGFITSGELPIIGVQEGDTLDTDYDGLKIVKSTYGNEHINLHKKSTDQWLIHGGLVPTSPGSNKYLITDNSGAMHWENISATNFVAGPGIKIDSPSAGTVRIGNDETVLFTTTISAATTADVSLSETRQNFERVQIYAKDDNDNMFTFDMFSDVSAVRGMGSYYNTYAQWIGMRAEEVVATDDTTLSVSDTPQISWNANGSLRNFGHGKYLKIIKVIGINRKAQ